MVAAWSYSAGYDIVEMGDDVSVVSCHASNSSSCANIMTLKIFYIASSYLDILNIFLLSMQ